MIRWGVIGLGNMGSKFAEAIKEIKNVKLNGVASLDKSKLDNFSKNFSVNSKKCFNNYDELINSSEIDAIYIATLNNTHLDLIIKCAKAKKNILCEKPLGLNLNQVKNAKKYIEENNVKFFEAIAYYSHPQTNILKKILSENEIGKILKIESSFGYKARVKPSSRLFSKELGGGAVLDVGCYPISFLMLFDDSKNGIKFLNKEISLSSTNVDDFAEANLKTSNDISANIKVSLKENFVNNCIIKGVNGEIVVPNPWIPGKKTFLEIKKNKKYYKKFIDSEKSIYAHQIEKVSKIFKDSSSNNEKLFDINKSLICSILLEEWIA